MKKSTISKIGFLSAFAVAIAQVPLGVIGAADLVDEAETKFTQGDLAEVLRTQELPQYRQIEVGNDRIVSLSLSKIFKPADANNGSGLMCPYLRADYELQDSIWKTSLRTTDIPLGPCTAVS